MRRKSPANTQDSSIRIDYSRERADPMEAFAFASERVSRLDAFMERYLQAETSEEKRTLYTSARRISNLSPPRHLPSEDVWPKGRPYGAAHQGKRRPFRTLFQEPYETSSTRASPPATSAILAYVTRRNVIAACWMPPWTSAASKNSKGRNNSSMGRSALPLRRLAARVSPQGS